MLARKEGGQTLPKSTYFFAVPVQNSTSGTLEEIGVESIESTTDSNHHYFWRGSTQHEAWVSTRLTIDRINNGTNRTHRSETIRAILAIVLSTTAEKIDSRFVEGRSHQADPWYEELE